MKNENNSKNEEVEEIEVNKKKKKVTESLSFFGEIIRNNKRLGQFNYKIISKCIKYIEYNENELIWEFGDLVDGLYLLVVGKVVLIKKNKNNDSEIKNYYEIGTLLGEDSFLDKKTYREYKLEAVEKCIIGFINIRYYDKIFNDETVIEKIKINKFLINLHYLTTEMRFVKKIQSVVQPVFYKKGSFIYKQFDPFKTFYIIRKGSILITLHFIKNYVTKLDNDILINKNILKDKNNTRNSTRFTFERSHELTGQYNEPVDYNIINLGEGEILGGIEYLYDLKYYIYNAICTTDVELLEFNIKSLKNIDILHDELKYFYKKIEANKDYFFKRFHEFENRIKFKGADYTTNKNKFIKTFINMYPLPKQKLVKNKSCIFHKKECAEDDKFINCYLKPFKKNKIYRFKNMRKTIFGHVQENISNDCKYKLKQSSSKNLNHSLIQKAPKNEIKNLIRKRNENARLKNEQANESSVLSKKNIFEILYNRLGLTNSRTLIKDCKSLEKSQSKPENLLLDRDEKIIKELSIYNQGSFSSLSENIDNQKGENNYIKANYLKNNYKINSPNCLRKGNEINKSINEIDTLSKKKFVDKGTSIKKIKSLGKSKKSYREDLEPKRIIIKISSVANMNNLFYPLTNYAKNESYFISNVKGIKFKRVYKSKY